MMIMNVIFVNDGACDGVLRQFWLAVLLFIESKSNKIISFCR